MKKVVYYLIAIIGVVFPIIAKAESYNPNIEMNKEEYSNLIELGFTESEIYFMGEKEFLDNKDLKGTKVAESVKYYATSTNSFTGDSITYIATLQEYERNAPLLATSSVINGYIETAYKKMTTTISAIGNLYRFKVTLTWKVMPATRSLDIIGIGLYPSEVYVQSNITFQQNYCYSNGNCISEAVYIPKTSSTGAAAIFALPTSSLSSLSSYLYYNVGKSNSGTLTSMYAMGDYSHATKAVSVSNINYSINAIGIVLNSSIISSYDAINTADARWTGTW